MVQIRNEVKGPVVTLTLDGENMHMYFTDLMGKIWDDYIREMLDNTYTRGLLKDLQFTEVHVFRMMEQLQVGRREFEENDYREVIYT